MKKIVSGISGIFIGCIVSSGAVSAVAPVVDHSTVASRDTAQSFAGPAVVDSAPEAVPAKSNLSVEQRINKIEQQVNNINGQNLASKLEEVQQNLQNVTGKLETATHQIEQLNKQLNDFYKDVNQRIGGGAVKPLTPQVATNVSVPMVAATNVPVPMVTATDVAIAATANTTNAAVDSSLVPATANNVANAFSGQPPESKSNPEPKPGSDSAFLKEQQAYQTAIDLLPEKKHESENKLREYIKQYPKGTYVANAHYWLGDINFIQKNFDAAEEEFKVVIDKHAKSKRVADAMLKLALVHQNQGREAQAKEELQKVIKRYPGTSAAQLAKQQLVTK